MHITDEQVIADRNDREMMLRPYLWTHPVLPLKRYRDGNLETAIYYNPNTTFGFVLDENANLFGPTGEPVKRRVYMKVDEIVDAGWMVD